MSSSHPVGLRERLADLFAVDLRSLGVYRIALGAVLLFEIVDRSRDLVSLYTDRGVMPAAVVRELHGVSALFSLHYHASGSVLAEGAVMGLAAAVAVALLVGYRTRAATIASWILLVSLQLRNPEACFSGADKLLRLALLWGAMLPLGARFSVDAARDRGAAPVSNRFSSVPAAALLIQIVLVYFVSGIKKSGGAWIDGSAVHDALLLDDYGSPVTAWLLGQAWLLPILTHGTRWLEILGSFFAFSPVWHGPLRTLTVAVFVSFHLGHLVFLTIGIFPAVCIAVWAVFLPPWFWDDLLPRLRRRPPFPATPLAPLRSRLATQVAGGLVLAYVLWFLTPQVVPGWQKSVGMPIPLTRVGGVLRINQYWRMFSPIPPERRSWPVVVGELANGGSVDPFRNAPVSWARPERDFFPSFRWRGFYTRLLAVEASSPAYVAYQRSLADYLCRRWNEGHGPGDRLLRVQMGFVQASFVNPSEAPRTGIMSKHECAPSSPKPDPSRGDGATSEDRPAQRGWT